MKNKMPWKYRIIIVILLLPAIIIPLVSLLTPYNLMINPLFMYGMIFSLFCAFGVDIYGMYIASKLHRKGETTK
jgi:hypothetical protein